MGSVVCEANLTEFYHSVLVKQVSGSAGLSSVRYKGSVIFTYLNQTKHDTIKILEEYMEISVIIIGPRI